MQKLLHCTMFNADDRGMRENSLNSKVMSIYCHSYSKDNALLHSCKKFSLDIVQLFSISIDSSNAIVIIEG